MAKRPILGLIKKLRARRKKKAAIRGEATQIFKKLNPKLSRGSFTRTRRETKEFERIFKQVKRVRGRKK